MNRVVLVGRLTKDPDTRTFEENGKVVTRFILAVDRPFKNGDGEREADFIPVVLWGRRAEIASEYMAKGRMISVSGRLQTGSYDDKEGKRKYSAEIIVDEFQFIDSKKAEENVG